MTKKILILGAGVMQVPIICKALEMGFETIVVDYDKNAPGFKYATKKYLVSTLDQDAILNIAKLENISGIITTSDAPVRVVAHVGKNLGLPTMSERVSEICTDKFAQRNLFKTSGINCPEFFLCDASTNLDEFKEFPYIVKPIDSSASRGVTKVRNKEELDFALKDALQFSKKGKAIIESFIPGREFSVETLTQNLKTEIITITEKLTKGESDGYFVEDTHIQPARITTEEYDLIKQEVKSALQAIGVDNCPTHTEIKINAHGAYIIEIACRLGGDYITSDLVPLSTGVDMLENLIKIAIGEPINTATIYKKNSAVQFINPENYNNCKQYIDSHIDEIIRYEISPYKDKPIKNSMDRLGYIILQSNDMIHLENELKKIK